MTGAGCDDQSTYRCGEPVRHCARGSPVIPRCQTYATTTLVRGSQCRLELVAEEERLVGVTMIFEPVERRIGDDIGGMRTGVLNNILRPRFVTLDAKLGIEILALARQHLVVVEVGLNLQMPFSDHRSLIAGLTHQDR